MDFYVKTVPFRRWWIRRYDATENSDTYDESAPLRVISNDKTFTAIVNVTATTVIAASSTAVVAACSSLVLDINRRASAKRRAAVALVNDTNGGGLVAGITPAYTPP